MQIVSLRLCHLSPVTCYLLLIVLLLAACGQAERGGINDPALHAEAARNNCRIRLLEDRLVDPTFAEVEIQYRDMFNERDLIIHQGTATERESGETVAFTCTVDRTAFNDFVRADFADDEETTGDPPDIPVTIEVGE